MGSCLQALLWPDWESNPNQILGTDTLYPLSYQAIVEFTSSSILADYPKLVLGTDVTRKQSAHKARRAVLTTALLANGMGARKNQVIVPHLSAVLIPNVHSEAFQAPW